MSTWTFIFLMVVLKLPILALFGLVWHAARAPEDEAEVVLVDTGDDDEESDEGGLGDRTDRERGRVPRRPRPRGPHGGEPVPSPPRTRTPARATRSRPTTPA